MCSGGEFFYIAGKVVLEHIKFFTDIPTLFFWQSSQLLASFLFNFKAVAHRFDYSLIYALMPGISQLAFAAPCPACLAACSRNADSRKSSEFGAAAAKADSPPTISC